MRPDSRGIPYGWFKEFTKVHPEMVALAGLFLVSTIGVAWKAVMISRKPIIERAPYKNTYTVLRESDVPENKRDPRFYN